MSRVITGTAKNKYAVVKSYHAAGPRKIRCPGCRVGLCLEKLGADGKKILYCDRCGRTITFQQL